MSNPTLRSAAEASDTLATLTAAASGLAALVYSVNVIEVFASEGAAELLGYVQMAGGALIVLVFAPMLIVLKRRGAADGASESYFGALLRHASFAGFSVTLAFMLMLSLLERRILISLSAATVVDLLISLALAVFALSFFLIDRFGQVGEAAGEER